MMPIPALSIRQPWVWSIQNLGKRVENRGWRTSHRGEFWIHAAQGCTYDEVEGWGHMVRAEKLSGKYAGQRFFPRNFERGGIVGIASIVQLVTSADELPEDQQPWFFGPVGFVLSGVRSFPLIPCKGSLGFFKVPPAIEAEARRLLA